MSDHLYSVVVRRPKAVKVEDDPDNPGWEIATICQDATATHAVSHATIDGNHSDSHVQVVPFGDAPYLCCVPRCPLPASSDGACPIHSIDIEDLDSEVA